ncbi:MAG: DUF4388 domain-containing protein [Acidobacteria bacterium]|nr:DUF4388 domain-containing protein [Acidobacteriota bacterium]NIM61377.1 DUF4388 domain-containing protein [Acidobacteriota bacterium]NIO58812.1 DUF4388 domain-containing protein [Acidobacteriota bacterium]NIQ29856.1 DUF4388 domain-containing protein [Acidobacteriota bacterium]NIQ84589.1 DUF4388 domain-containing protein [Acidobacteriota bacterium]
MGLMGTLDTMSLGDLLAWISTARKSGVVTVASGKNRLQLSVGGSRILGAYSNEPPMLLGQFLLSRGKIDEVALHDALARQDSTREHLGKVLTEMGAITKDELDLYVVLKAEETIFNMLEWSEAMFEFDIHAEADPRMVRMDHGIDDLIMRGAQRGDELAQMRKVLGDPGVVLCRTEIELPAEARDSPMAARIYDAIDGKRTLADILLNSRASDYFATKFLYELLRAGVVRIKDVQETQPEPGSPRAILGAVNELLAAEQFEGAVSLLSASLKVFPDNAELQQMLTKAEADFLDHTYKNRLSPTRIPRLIVPADKALAREDIGPNERFILDLANQGTWDVKAMTRIAPLHEVDVVRATLNLLDKQLIEITGEERPADTPAVEVMGDELRRLAGEVHAAAVEGEVEDRLEGSGDGATPDEISAR